MAAKKTTVPAPEPVPERTPEPAPAAGTGLMVMDFGDDAGKGTEGVTREELRIPMLTLLQSNSPQCKPPANGGVAGAKPGMIVNTATGQLFDGDGGLEFVPVQRDRKFVRWVPRKAGGGFVAALEPDDPLVARLRAKSGKFGKLVVEENDRKNPDPGAEGEMIGRGEEIVETFYLYGICVTDGGERFMALLPFKSTQIGKYQAFVTRATGFEYNTARGPVRPPLWAHRWRLTTRFESNKKGEYYGWVLSLAAKNADGTERPSIDSVIQRTDPRYVAAAAFYEMIRAGQVEVDHAAAADAAGEGGEAPRDPRAGRPRDADLDEEIPF